jgi:hypothetical protein
MYLNLESLKMLQLFAFGFCVERPCTHSICREHLIVDNVRKLNKLKCAESNEEFKVKESEFKSCHFMKQILGNFFGK